MKEKIKLYIWGNGKISRDFMKKAQFRDNVCVGGVICTSEEHGAVCYKDVTFKKTDMVIIAVSNEYTDEILKTILFDTNLEIGQIVALSSTVFSAELGVGTRQLYRVIYNVWDFITVADRKITTLAAASDFERAYIGTLIPDYKQPLHDYMRIKTFELCADEIINKNLKGDVAELGVFQGDFAKFINKKFPERRLYLFDTFEGFDEEQLSGIEKEDEKDFFRIRFADTTIQSVLDKMTTPENCVIKKGLFPQSLGDMDGKYVFVSLDADLKEPIYEGLRYFYPRLVEGGYIFVHDYNQWSLVAKQVKEAVEQYEQEFHELVKVPIADRAGTLVITK